MIKLTLLSGGCLAFLSVALGAFGAHGLKDILNTHQTLSVFQTASQYHFYHALALVLLALLMQQFGVTTLFKISAFSFIIGILIFSGSLYTLAITNIKWLGAITPIGGLLFLSGWLCMIINVQRQL